MLPGRLRSVYITCCAFVMLCPQVVVLVLEVTDVTPWSSLKKRTRCVCVCVCVCVSHEPVRIQMLSRMLSSHHPLANLCPPMFACVCVCVCMCDHMCV